MSKTALFQDGPTVYTLPASARFADSLARLLQSEFPDPDALSQLILLVPTRRAGRVLSEAFARSQKGVALLPSIRPIGDVDADDPPFEPGELADIAPPAINPARRRFELARLILARESASGRSMGPGGALVLADELAGLIDDLATEGVDDLSGLDDTIRSHLPEHMQESAMFLDIVMSAWPERLKELGVIDPAHRRSLLLGALARRWSEHPPDGPVIAAGSTGSIPAASDLLITVANLDQGAVILPGLHTDMDQPAWDAIDSGHPQRAMKIFLDRLGLKHDQIPVLPGTEMGRTDSARARIITEAMRPAEATSDWVNRVETLKKQWGEDIFETGLAGLSVIEAENPLEESRTIALILKHSLTEPDLKTIVVTPDMALASRIKAEMLRFDVQLDDSGGQVLSDTPPLSFLMRILEVAVDPGSALALTALWASPLFGLGRDRARLRPSLGDLERVCLTGRRPGRNLFDVSAKISKLPDTFSEQKQVWLELMRDLETGIQPLLDLPVEATVAERARTLAQCAEVLAATDTLSGPDHLWVGDAGEAAASLISDLIHEADALPPVSGEDFRRVLLEMARSRRVRPQFGGHPRLQLLGPLEARLVSADRVILAGLNEGTWPAAAKIDPFLSRGMREAAGLSMPEERFGLAAHDFAQLTAANDVILTRSTKADGAPTVASRWLWRLQTLTQGALGKSAAEACLKPTTPYLDLVRLMDQARQVTRIDPPDARPPVEARPRELPVTQVETWVRDPYAIYARYVLGLKRLDPLDMAPGPRERGIAYHAAIEAWIKSVGSARDLPEDSLDQLIAAGQAALSDAGFSAADMALEMTRFRRVAAWLAEREIKTRSRGYLPLAMEIKGSMTLEGPVGDFVVTARADRMDVSGEGRVDILDYKTGALQTDKAVAAGYAPQLPLEAAMLKTGGFESVTAEALGELIYVRVSGGKDVGEVRHMTAKVEADELAFMSVKRLLKWIECFDDPDQGYRSQISPQFSRDTGDYDHLARRKEWASAPESGDDS